MIRALVIVVLVLLGLVHANAALLRGNGGAANTACVFTGAQVNGSCVQATAGSFSSFLGPDGLGDSWGFNGTIANGQCDNNSPQNCLLVVCNPSCAASNAFGYQIIWQSAAYMKTVFPTCGQLYRGLGSVAGWATVPGTLIGNGFFVNSTTATSYKSMSALISGMSLGQTITVNAPPWGTCWPEDGGISIPNITINLGTTHFADATTSKGTFNLVGTADGGSAANVVFNGGDIKGAIKISDGATNNTIENMTLHEGCQLVPQTCILTGGGVGTTTLLGDLVYLGGTPGSGGQDHNVYLSAKGAGAVDTSCYAINGLTSLNSIGEGWLLKLRTICSSGQQGDVTNSVIATTVFNASPNGVVDYPCGGNHKIEHSVLENKFNQSGSAGWYIIKYGEEVPNLPSGCPSNVGQVNTLAINLTYIMNDAPGNSSGFESILCTEAGASGSPAKCLPSTLPGYSATMTNSVIVGNAGIGYMINAGGFTNGGVGCTLSSGKCTDANNNRWYQDRTTAAANEGWSGNYTDPSNGTVTPCCAWPWLPPHM